MLFWTSKNILKRNEKKKFTCRMLCDRFAKRKRHTEKESVESFMSSAGDSLLNFVLPSIEHLAEKWTFLLVVPIIRQRKKCSLQKKETVHQSLSFGFSFECHSDLQKLKRGPSDIMNIYTRKKNFLIFC